MESLPNISSAPVPDSSSAAPKVLVVEDVAVNRQVINLMLQALGYTPRAVNNGKEALETMRVETFDLILMDCIMPVMDGFKTTQSIRSGQSGVRQTALPIIAMTASAMDGDRQKCLDAGMTDYLPKPIRKDELDGMLMQYLGKATGR